MSIELSAVRTPRHVARVMPLAALNAHYAPSIAHLRSGNRTVHATIAGFEQVDTNIGAIVPRLQLRLRMWICS